MSKARVVELHVISGQLSVTEAARTYNLSRQHIYRLLKRYHQGGLDAVEPRSRRPASNPHAVSDDVIAAIVHLREQLTADGLDAGPITLQGHLHQAGLTVPSTSTIRRILGHHALITPQPRKRPRSSYHRLPPNNPTNAGNPTSPTGPWPTAPTPKSSTGSTTTPDTCCHAPRTTASAAPTSSPPSPPPPNSACPRPPSLTMLRSTPHDSPTATTTSNASWPAWASPRKTDTPATPTPKAK